MSFANMKKQSQLGSLTDKLVKQVEKMNNTGGGGGVDERFWKPEMDKTGNGYAVIRFLPAPDGEELPWVKMYSHAFQGPGGWYIENSLTTLGQKDPVSEHNRELWNSGIDADKETVRKQKRKLSYYANIYVVKDPAHPENEGNVFLYKFGKKIFDKILAAMQPEFEDEEAINPFDFWQGANFKLKLKKVAGYWNYDASEFAAPGALLSDDDALEALWKKEYSLAALTAADQFKSYEDLDKRLKMVLGKKSTATTVREQEEQYSNFERTPTREENVMEELEASYRKSKAPEMPQSMRDELNNISSGSDFNSSDITPSKSSEEEDDALSYFQRLAEE